jgi:hypothetical protein
MSLDPMFMQVLLAMDAYTRDYNAGKRVFSPQRAAGALWVQFSGALATVAIIAV